MIIAFSILRRCSRVCIANIGPRRAVLTTLEKRESTVATSKQANAIAQPIQFS
ncbi:hypothetical protein [Nostoc sp. CHAB 5715]|uniref:hypothetical protein n=1 Tax=Nostoc sp. CHAB 5715 TaxID=2780400 RepID=UPI001E4E9028|nr:hypothetical protein [Nostoc sp. CHAB 5715]MCC5621400.1 hypothetical protein [Nostoc sp. CHAB 5715]